MQEVLELECACGVGTGAWPRTQQPLLGAAWGILRGDGVPRHKPSAGDAGKPSCPDTLLKPTEFAPPSARRNSQTWPLQAPPDPYPTWLVQLMPTHQRRRLGFGNLRRSLRITSPLFPAPLNSICNLKLPAGIPARTSPPRGGAGFQPMAPADKHREKAATVRENFGERLLEAASDKEGIVRQMERNSARWQPRAPSELREQPSRR